MAISFEASRAKKSSKQAMQGPDFCGQRGVVFGCLRPIIDEPTKLRLDKMPAFHMKNLVSFRHDRREYRQRLMLQMQVLPQKLFNLTFWSYLCRVQLSVMQNA